MSTGTAMRNGVTSAITNLGSTLTITPYTLAANTDGGHTGQVEVPGTAVSETAIPFRETKKIIKENFGDLEAGQFRLALKYTAVFEITGSTKYKVTWNSEVYDIINLDRYSIDNTLIAWIITVSKRHD